MCVHVRVDAHRKNIYRLHFCICLITHWNRETGEKTGEDTEGLRGAEGGKENERLVDAY